MVRPSLVVVLAEDERHQRFVRKYLYRKGLKPHEIRMEPLPAGRGCGEQWVRDWYPVAVQAYRSRSAKAQSALVVVIDADTGPVQVRQQQLRQALQQATVPERSDVEWIAHFIPKRSIETWVLCLTDRPVDEDTDYSRDAAVDDLFIRAASQFFEVTRANTGPIPGAIDSLLAAIPEARRLK